MTISRKKKILLIVATLIGIIAFLIFNGLWRKMLSNPEAWEIIEQGDAYAVYIDVATNYFGSTEIASDTYRDWVTSHWKSHRTFRVTEQRFLTNGVVFVIRHTLHDKNSSDLIY